VGGFPSHHVTFWFKIASFQPKKPFFKIAVSTRIEKRHHFEKKFNSSTVMPNATTVALQIDVKRRGGARV